MPFPVHRRLAWAGQAAPLGRALPAAELADHLKRYNKSVAVCDSIQDGVTLALDRSDEDSVVCAVGSLYSVGEIRYFFGKY